MQARKFLALANVDRLAICPASSLVFTAPWGVQEYAAIDLAGSKVAWKASPEDVLGPPRAQDDEARKAVTYLNATGDGKYLFCMNGQGLHRARIESDGCVFEERVDCDGGSMDISLDSSRIVRHTYDPALNRDPKVPVVSHICQVGNLARPLRILKFSGKSLPATVDPVTKRVYSADPTGIGVLDTVGQAVRSFPMEMRKTIKEKTGGKLDASRLLPHPKGNAVLLMANGMGFFIEVPKDKGEP
jgi:hypothetical protein